MFLRLVIRPELRPRTSPFRQTHRTLIPSAIAQTAQRAAAISPSGNVRSRAMANVLCRLAISPRDRRVPCIALNGRKEIACRTREQYLFSNSAAMLGRSYQIYATNTLADRSSNNILALSANGGQGFRRNSVRKHIRAISTFSIFLSAQNLLFPCDGKTLNEFAQCGTNRGLGRLFLCVGLSRADFRRLQF